MATMTKIKCKCGCGRSKEVRTADVKRGWGKFYDKSCKAKSQAKKHGGRSKPSKEKRVGYLREAFDDGRISEEYFFMTMESEYPEFMTADESAEACHISAMDAHPFSSEALGQD